MHKQNRLGLVAIDEAHLVYDWQDFRQTYKRCKELHGLLPNIPIMALSATVTAQVEDALKSFLKDPVVLRSTVNRENIYLHCVHTSTLARFGSVRYGNAFYSHNAISPGK